MQRFIRLKARAAAALLLFLMLILPLGARAEQPLVFTVTTRDPSGPGSLGDAIEGANAAPPGSSVTIAIEVSGEIPSMLTPLGVLAGKEIAIQSHREATLLWLTCHIGGGGKLTLHDVHIDNSLLDFPPFRIFDTDPGNTLFLSGSTTVLINATSADPIISLETADLTIDKVPGGTDLDCSLTMKNALIPVYGQGTLTLKGGTVYARGRADGIHVSLLVKGGKLTAEGGFYGISGSMPRPGKGHLQFDGGTTVAWGEVRDIDASGSTKLVINGGSVNARSIGGTPVNSAEVPVYLVTVTVGDPAVEDTEVACSVNGGAAFPCATDGDGKLYLWMPAGDGEAEIITAERTYSASGTVEQNYDNAMLARPTAVVTGVVVTPASATAQRGASVQFSAVVEGFNTPPQDVIWTVENGHAGTSIDATGLLTISAGETSRTLLVTATSAADPNYSDTAEVAVAAFSRAAALLLLAIFLVLLLTAVLLVL